MAHTPLPTAYKKDWAPSPVCIDAQISNLGFWPEPKLHSQSSTPWFASNCIQHLWICCLTSRMSLRLTDFVIVSYKNFTHFACTIASQRTYRRRFLIVLTFLSKGTHPRYRRPYIVSDRTRIQRWASISYAHFRGTGILSVPLWNRLNTTSSAFCICWSRAASYSYCTSSNIVASKKVISCIDYPVARHISNRVCV